MEVLLVNPPWSVQEKHFYRKINSRYAPLGLAYIASVLERNNIDVRILDCQALDYNLIDFEDYLKREKPKIVGIFCVTTTVDMSVRTAESSKKINPNTKTILGGPHATIMPRDLMANKDIDYVVYGEGEYTALELTGYLLGKSTKKIEGINGIYYKKNGTVHNTAPREYIKNLDEIPHPAYHLLPVERYKPGAGTYKKLPAMNIISSRGCPYNCTFCSKAIFGKTYRERSADNVVDEIKYLATKFGVRDIVFNDDTITINKKRLIEICDKMKKEGLDIAWSCMGRVNNIDEEMLNAMKKAGCIQICYGIESGDEGMLKSIKKGITLEQVRKAVKITKKVGIEVRGSFIMGSPGETRQTLQKTIDFSKELDLDIAAFNIATPFPGTEMFTYARENNLLMTENWADYDMYNQIIKLPDLREGELHQWYRKAFREFYIRPRYIASRITKIRSIEDIKDIANVLKSIFKK